MQQTNLRVTPLVARHRQQRCSCSVSPSRVAQYSRVELPVLKN